MKSMLFFAFAWFSVSCFAQLPANGKKITGPITTKKGVVLKTGDKVRFGEGGLSSGGYQNIYTSFDKFGQKTASLEEGYAYKYAVVKEFREVGTGDEKRFVALVKPKGGISVNLRAIDLEPAMASKEIISINDVAIIKLIPKKQI